MNASISPETSMTPDLGQIPPVRLVALCAENIGNHELWSEFLRRFSGRVKMFIRGTLRRSAGNSAAFPSSAQLSGATEADLLQSVILRLVDNNCSALKRFRGTTEQEVLAYFAVIARSVVRDFLRRQSALKRPQRLETIPEQGPQITDFPDRSSCGRHHPVEREILVRELVGLSKRAIDDNAAECSDRDRLIFKLYFYGDLSLSQISKCAGIGLSKTGVEKVLDRLEQKIRRSAMEPHPAEAEGR